MLCLFKINFHGFRRFLIHGNSSYVVLYTQCLRYNICSTWLLDIEYQLVSFISQSLLNRFHYNLYYYLPYACSTSTAIFRLILLLKVTPESLLHSRVKHSITHIPVVICSSNFNEGLLY